MKSLNHRHNERGATIAELAVVALLFFTIIFGIIEFGRLIYTHNALTDATRRGARYAVLHNGLSDADKTKVKNYVCYGNDKPALDASGNPTAPLLVNGLTPDKVTVEFDGIDKDGDPATPEKTAFGSNLGTATVKIENYEFNLSIPVIGRVLTLPTYETTLTAESAGEIPDPIDVGP